MVTKPEIAPVPDVLAMGYGCIGCESVLGAVYYGKGEEMQLTSRESYQSNWGLGRNTRPTDLDIENMMLEEYSLLTNDKVMILSLEAAWDWQVDRQGAVRRKDRDKVSKRGVFSVRVLKES